MRQDYKLVTVRGLFDSKESYADKTVTVGGWIRNNRDSKAIGFIALADGSCFQNLQLVYSKDLENFAEIAKMNVGTAIIATGKIVLTPNAKQPLEMQVEKIELEGASTSDYPLQKKRHSFEYPHQYFCGNIPRALPDRVCDPLLLHGERLRLCALPHYHGQ